MSINNTLVYFNGYANDFTDLDAESPDHHLNMHELPNKEWPEKQGNFDTSPILDAKVWRGFNTDDDGITKLVSSEEDLICSSPEQENKISNHGQYHSENWEKEFPFNLNNHSIINDMEPSADGFASNEVITIGDFNDEDENQSSPESHSKTMADRWSSNDYNTVLRINCVNDRKVQLRNGDRGSNDTVNRSARESVNSSYAEENNCTSCREKVYITEKLVIDNLLYHRQCFKCMKCRRILSMNNFASNSGRLYCKPHFLELFRQSGKYNEFQQQSNQDLNSILTNSYKINENGTEGTDNTQTDELPPPQMTKNIVEKFRLLESNLSTDSLLPRQLSGGQQNLKCYQSTNVVLANHHAYNEKVNDATDEFPTPGITKNLLSLWSNFESKSLYTSASGTPKKINKINSPKTSVSFQSFDIVRHNDSVEDKYPAPNTAKSLAAKFKGEAPMRNQSHSVVNRSSSVNRNILIPNFVNQCAEVVSSSTLNDDWLQCRISNPNEGSENNPIQRPDLISSESKREVDEFPEEGITKNLVGLFRSMEVKRQWYKERLQMKYLNKNESNRPKFLLTDDWIFLKDCSDDCRDGYPPIIDDSAGIIKGKGSINPNFIESKDIGKDKLPPIKKRQVPKRFSKNDVVYSKTAPLKTQHQYNIEEIELGLIQHPLALFPHLESSLPSEIFEEIVDIIDPDMNVSASEIEEDAMSVSSKSNRSVKLDVNVSNKSPTDSPKVTDRFPPNAFKWISKKEEKEKLNFAQNEKKLKMIAENEHIKEVTKEFCSWVADLGGQSNNIEEPTVTSLFASGYETKPTLSVPIHVIELTSIPPELRGNVSVPTKPDDKKVSDNGSVNKIYETASGNFQHFQYGAWYLPSKFWTKKPAGTKLQDPKLMFNFKQEEHKAKVISLNTELAHLQGPKLFSEFIYKTNKRKPKFLDEVAEIEDQIEREKNQSKEDAKT